MKKLLIRLATVGAVGAIAVAATGAFFSDTEESLGNSLVAGAIDLKVDNTCYYNGQACTNGFWGGVPNASPNPTNTCSCTWLPKDLEEGDTFFELADLKPGDWEEDTISLTVDNNDAWACVNLSNVVDVDVTCTEPEGEDGDVECGLPPYPTPAPTGGLGELSQVLNFVFWKDDGDNVLESDEYGTDGSELLAQGPASAVLGGVTWALSDSTGSVFNPGPSPVPLTGEQIYYIGKAWCYGTFTFTPVNQDGHGDAIKPTDLTGPGFTCDGTPVNNVSQTDKLTADISFYATQARNNGGFVCGLDWPPVIL